jgi:capsular exopolysaccharide synthesis family protein
MSNEHDPCAPYPPPAVRRTGNGHLASHAREGLHSARANESRISHTFLLWVLQQWWMIVIPAGVVIAGLAAGVVLFLHVPQYEASALLMIEDVNPFVAFSSRDTGNQSQRYVQTQLELLRSPVVLEPVLGRSEIASMSELMDQEDRVAFLRDQVSIKQVGQSELYDITYRSASPQDASNVVNAVVAEYININTNDESQRSQRVIDILEEERRRRGLEVERLRKFVVNLAKEVTGRDPLGGNEVTNFRRAMSPAGEIFRSLTEVEVEHEVLKAEMQSVLDAPALTEDKAESSGLLDLEIENQEEIRSRNQAIKDLEADMEAAKHEAVRYQKKPDWERDPGYMALMTEWKQRQDDLTEAKHRLREVILAQRKAKQKAEQDDLVTRRKRKLESLEARRQLLSKRFTEQVEQMQSGGGKGVELEFARAELDREEKVFELIASRKLALQTELRAPARIQLRRKANVPTVPVEPVPYKLLFLACSCALVAPFGLAVLREMTVRRISDVEQLAQESNLRILGEVAALPVRYVAVSPHQLSGRIRRDTYIFAESINSLRTNLTLATGLTDQQVLAVTSASPSEGKTSVAVSLALSIANATGQPTLIIDGDMRSPFVSTMLKTKNQPGLFELLSNKCKLEDVIQQVEGSDLHVIAGGRATRSTHSVACVAELQRLLDELRPRYSTIVIDTPPILGASESLVLAKAAGSVLFCTLCNVSKAKQVRLAIERLENAQVNVAGAVLSGTPAKRYEYVYGYYANRIEADN